MRILTKLCNMILIAIAFSSCSSPNNECIRINIGGDPATLDPRMARDLQSMTLVKFFFDGLTRINKEGKPELSLAEKVDISLDGLTYTFHLRDALWNTGEKVTAHHFAYAWSTVLGSHFPSDQAFQLYPIKNAKECKEGKVSFEEVGVKVIDDQTLEVRLIHPTPYFLELTALPVYFPLLKTVDEKHPHWSVDTQFFMYNGPFLMKEWKHHDCLSVVANPEYWDAKNVHLKKIDLVMVSEEAELSLYERKELDWAGSPLSTLPVGSLEMLKKQGKIHVKPMLGTYFFRINTEDPFLQNPLVRRALALCVKREEIIEHVTQGYQLPAFSLIPPSLKVSEMTHNEEEDITEAQALFEKALQQEGLSLKALPTLSLMYIAGERNHLISQAVQSQWKKLLGIDVQLHAVERKVFYDRTSKKHFQIAASSWVADYSDPLNFLEIFKFKNGGSNNTGWENKRYKTLLDQALHAVDLKQRQHIFQECESILREEMPIIPIFHYTLIYLCNPKIHQVVVSNLGGIDFKWAFMEGSEEKSP
ncbi:peptide ABC transporter substrate-binding protein [Rhabdochlamydiaceae symbiont of Dictyostelium giganteum]|uniref:peptide ABC transporter substrate-binding protein n=1 Tax=Rhabdochlamydiaceae symbiont of Dictyostelium giganteum TaxID=3342349 RepID=UPI00384B8F50